MGYINEVFRRLTAICPAWKQAFSSTEELNAVKQEWITGFYDSGIRSKAVVDFALAKLRDSGTPFLPTVGQFIGWCREGMIPEGTKTPLQAYKEISQYQCLPSKERKPQNVSREVWHTLVNLQDLHAWKHMEKEKHKKYWDAQYEETLELLRTGQPLEEAPPERQAIEKKGTPLNKQKAISALQKMREGL